MMIFPLVPKFDAISNYYLNVFLQRRGDADNTGYCSGICVKPNDESENHSQNRQNNPFYMDKLDGINPNLNDYNTLNLDIVYLSQHWR